MMAFRRMHRPKPSPDPDLRSGLLAVVCLFFILLPCLMLTTSLYRLTSLPFILPATGAMAAPLRPSPLEAVEVLVEADAIRVRAALRTTDVRAMEGQGVWNETLLPSIEGRPDLTSLRRRLVALHGMDPENRRITVIPDDRTSTDDLVAIMDTVRGGPDGPLFDEITLGTVPVPATP